MSAAIADHIAANPPVKLVRENDRMAGKTPTGPCKDRAYTAKSHEDPIRTHQLRVFPTKEQHIILQAWLAADRWGFNACVAANNNRTRGEWITVEKLRQDFRYNAGIVEQVRLGKLSADFALDILTLGSDMRDRAIDDFVKARNHELKKWRADRSHHFKFRFRSRRDDQSLAFENREWGKGESKQPCPAQDVSEEVRKAAQEAAARVSAPATNKRQQRKQQVDAKRMAARARDHKLVVEAIANCKLQTSLRRVDVMKMPPPRLKKRYPTDWEERWAAKIPVEMPMLYNLTYTRRGRYYLKFRLYKPVKPVKPEPPAPATPKHSVASLDPGSRCPLVIYDCDGRVIEVAPGDGYRLYQTLRQADRIKSRLDRVVTQGKPRSEFPEGSDGTAAWRKHNQQARNRSKHHRRALHTDFLARLERVRNRVRDLHAKTAAWLVTTYRTILIPTFETSQMVVKWRRKLNHKATRQLLCWSHHAFRQTLKQRAERQQGCLVLDVTEPYTSQSCGRCGSLWKTSSKRYVCHKPGCGYVADRDANGARNIELRYLTLSQICS